MKTTKKQLEDAVYEQNRQIVQLEKSFRESSERERLLLERVEVLTKSREEAFRQGVAAATSSLERLAASTLDEAKAQDRDEGNASKALYLYRKAEILVHAVHRVKITTIQLPDWDQIDDTIGRVTGAIHSAVINMAKNAKL